MADIRSAEHVPKTFKGFVWSKVIDTLTGASAIAQGDVLYRGATQWTRLPPSTVGRVLATAGTGGNPSWATMQSLANSTYVIYAASDQTKTSDDVLADDATLVTTLVANSKYRLRFDVWFESGSVPDLKWDLAFTGTTTSILVKSTAAFFVAASLATGSSTATSVLFGYSTIGVVRTDAAAGGSDIFALTITAAIETGASGGTFSLRWAQNTSSGTATTRRRNSTLMVTECS